MDHIPQSHDSPHVAVKIPYLLEVIDDATKDYWSGMYDAATSYQDIPLDASLDSLSLTQYLTTSQNSSENSEELKPHVLPQNWVECDDHEGLILNGWNEVLPYLQFTCYFNLLKLVFAVPKIEIEEKDFLDEHEGQTMVTTASLPGYLEEWKRAEAGISTVERAKKHNTIDGYLSRACEYAMSPGQSLTEIFQTLRTGATPSGNIAMFELANKVCLSITILIETLWHASKVIYEVDGKPHSGLTKPSNPLNLDRFLKAGWCQRDYQMAADDVFGDDYAVQFMLSSINRQNDIRDHSSCSNQDCMHDQVGTGDYDTRHVEKWKCCAEVVLEDSEASSPVISLIKRGLTPILQVRQRRSDGSPMVSVIASHKEETGNNLSTEHSPGHVVSYVAFSHVWSQGLGNPARNALPKCQLVRLQALADQFAPPESRPVAFWIDTLCVPIQKEYRNLAITAMSRVYKEARYVLVLDSSLLAVSKSLPPIEINMRIAVSTWTQRLWTYQESSLAQTLCFQFRDGPMDTDTNYIRYLENLPARVQNIDDDFNRTAAKRMVELVWVESFRAIENLSFATAYDPRAGQHNWIPILTAALAVRSSTKQEDQALCIASILGKEVKDLVLISGNLRMRSLFLSLDFVPPSILFCSRPRYMKRGCRWIPKSLLRSPTAIKPYTDMRQAEITTDGLCVKYPGIKWMLGPEATSPLKLREVLVRLEAGGRMYKFRAPTYDSDKQAEEIDIHQGKSYGVIWPDNYPGKIGAGQDHKSFKESEVLPAALVTIDTRSNDRVDMCSFLTNMEVHRLIPRLRAFGDKSSATAPNVQGEMMEDGHMWCVG